MKIDVTDRAPKPIKWKMVLLVWPVVLVLIFSLSAIENWLFPTMPFFLRMVLTSLVIVTCMVYVIIPMIQKLFSNWLNKK